MIPDELLNQNEVLRAALRYISCPTMGYPGTATMTPEMWAATAAPDVSQLALVICIRTATEALKSVQDGATSPVFDYMRVCRDERDALLREREDATKRLIELVGGSGGDTMEDLLYRLENYNDVINRRF